MDKGILSIPSDVDYRSLIALALIMSLLQFKPAPMYILDEVDAALDLSHTQNIGRLIKTRFKGYITFLNISDLDRNLSLSV